MIIKNYNCYIHIPFCRSKCKYCRFASFSVLDNIKIENYINFLCNEILTFSSFNLFIGERNNSIIDREFVKDKKNGKLDTIYFGGGTPAILSEQNLEKIFKSLKKNYIFSKNIEITMETTPEEISLEKLRVWQEFGVNRLSIGIQTLNKITLETIGRSKKSLNIKRKLDLIKEYLKNEKYKLKYVSIDFIIGLPFVKFGEILENIKYLIKKYDFINHISVYMLEDYYNHGELSEKFDKIIYPDDWKKKSISQNQIGREYIKIKNFLEKKGFYRYELSNFAKTSSKSPHFQFENISFSELGDICKHNLGYWNHKETLAFGLGASGFLNGIRYKNSDDFLDYYSFKVLEIEKLSSNDLFLEKMMFSLRSSGIPEKIYKKLNQDRLDYFIKNGYLEKKDFFVNLTDKGVLFLDYILGELII